MRQQALPLRALNHISRVCKDVATSAAFYRDVLGFSEVKRPSSFEFEGAWLFNYGIGIHLIAGKPIPRSSKIEPKSDHLSFQVDCLEEVGQQLSQMGVEYVKQTIEEAGVMVTQLFFHDPDNNMIEICNCDLIPLVPLETELICTTCMSTSIGLNRAISLSTHLPPHRLSHGLSSALEEHMVLSESSHSHTSSVTAGSVDQDLFACEAPSTSLLTALMHESTPHTGIRPSGHGIRRSCSMGLLANSNCMQMNTKDMEPGGSCTLMFPNA